MSEQRAYQVCIYAGAAAPALPGVTMVSLLPQSALLDDVLEAVRSSGLTPADLRSRTLLLYGFDDPSRASMLYAALVGFSGRRLDFSCGGPAVDATDLYEQGRMLESDPKPDEPVEEALLGLVDGDLPVVAALPRGDDADRQQVGLLRWARRLRMAQPAGTLAALSEVLVVSGVRCRNGADRMPVLCDADGVEHDLDAARRAGGELRRSIRTDDRGAVVEPVALTARQRRLTQAALVPVEDVLLRLGSFQSPDTGLWRCPRPERHRNGDANPSTQCEDGLVRCFRCDAEPVDALRLVMDARGISPDEAADWIAALD